MQDITGNSEVFASAKNGAFRKISHKADLCIVGGGLSGLCAAVAAARHGTKVILIQDRPMLGGNCSSEIRMWIRGAKGMENRESGIVEELELENIWRNPHMSPSVFDSVMYGAALREKNLTLLMNTSCADAVCENGVIKSVSCWQLTTYQWHTVEATLFADCSGDSILAPLVGADFVIGREDKKAYDEDYARDVADKMTMGNSCLIQARETTKPVKFNAPDWAHKFTGEEGDKYLTGKQHGFGKVETNYWWIELGGNLDSLNDAEAVRDDLIKTAYGVWDHIKNHGDHGAENYELEWIGFLPGKRESRRYIGEYMLTANDIKADTTAFFDDTVAFGGWPMDDHDPLGVNCPGKTSVFYKVKLPFQIPYRSLYSKNIKNLMFAGRNISATHMAMSSTRVMATCALMGQAMGTAASVAVKHACTPHEVYLNHMKEVQNILQYDNIYLPGFTREIDEVNLKAELLINDLPATKEQKVELFSGIDRPHPGMNNLLKVDGNPEASITFKFDTELENYTLRLVFGPDYDRTSISTNAKHQMYAMKSASFLDEENSHVKMPNTLVKVYEVIAISKSGEVLDRLQVNGNYQSHKLHALPKGTSLLKLVIKKNNRQETENGTFKLYACDVVNTSKL